MQPVSFLGREAFDSLAEGPNFFFRQIFLFVFVTCPHEWNQCLSPG